MLLALLLAATTTTATPIPLDKAHRAFEEVRLAAEEEGGKLWGVPLAGPMIFVDRETRFAVANQRDAEGALQPAGPVFTGTVPPHIVLANTATTWAGVRWTMVVWGAVSDRTVPRRRLLFHETWHRIQGDLGFPGVSTPVSDLESLEGRYWLQLELRALEAALRGSDEKRQNAIRDALTFRVRRRKLLPSAGEHERALEANEGLAEYTGFAMRGTSDSESRIALAERLARLDREASFVRSFAYETGPAYGLLLDAAAPGWTRRFRPTDDLSVALGIASRVKIDESQADAAASRYGGSQLRAAEQKRAKERAERTARYRALFVDGPVLEISLEGARYGFDPNTVFSLEAIGSYYPTLDVTGDWGRLSVKDGAVIASDFKRVLVPANGKGWTLDLNPGWKIAPGTRPGDQTVARSE
ncbi:MAG TPA: hypothetical protein VFL80_10390 [Thermoanaerobaculia bacterium]|nr:hypothetical protein [Thermoanaerobaculia bacterium]